MVRAQLVTCAELVWRKLENSIPQFFVSQMLGGMKTGIYVKEEQKNRVRVVDTIAVQQCIVMQKLLWSARLFVPK